MDSRIGQLMKEGRLVHYAFLHGYDKPEFQGSLEEVEVALGLRGTPVRHAAPRKETKRYTVTVTPKIEYWIGSTKMGQYDVDLTAADAADAIKQARQARRDNEGRFAVPAKFTAKLSV